VDMDGGESDAEGVARLGVGGVQQKQQRHRVRASGDGGADAVSRANVGAVQRGLGVCHGDFMVARDTGVGAVGDLFAV
jgi:hypothetical protein